MAPVRAAKQVASTVAAAASLPPRPRPYLLPHPSLSSKTTCDARHDLTLRRLLPIASRRLLRQEEKALVRRLPSSLELGSPCPYCHCFIADTPNPRLLFIFSRASCNWLRPERPGSEAEGQRNVMPFVI